MSSLSGIREYVTSLTSSLVRINSENPPGREGEIASYVAERLAELGLKAWVDRFDDRANALGSIKTGDGPKILLMPHLDTVPAGGKELWSVPPFSGTIKDGRIYGRGAVDAKGCIASMIGALKLLSDEGWPIRGEILFAAVADEEVENKGVRRLLAQKVEADYAVVGEPTNLMVCPAHKGTLFLWVNFYGRAAHSSRPDRGINAVYAASSFALKIERLARRFKTRHSLLGRPTLALTIMRGGLKDNIIPDYCETIVNRRTLPGERLEKILKQLRRVAETSARTWGARTELRIKRYLPASETDRREKIVKVAVESVSKILGRRVRPRGFQATCDMTFLIHGARIPSIILGPGKLEQAHTVDEWVGIDQLVDASRIYREIILKLLGSS